ncbi:MAG: ABC transporter substrate-binding protein [Candidatus Limiplasma sp.]|nr:ABC transporter substrate-binding protein [Candidatus Limiplasma sp.]
MKKVLSLILAMVMLLSVSAMAAAEGETINVGCLQDISGPTSSLGNMVTAGAQWAVDEINAAGGIGGKQINLIVYDTKGDVTEAINAYTRAVSTDAVSAIIGPPVANIALAIAPESENNNVPVLGFAIDTKCQIKPDGTPYKNMFAFQPNAVQQGTIMASYALKNGFKKFGVIYNEGNAYSVSLQAPFIETATTGGAEVAKVVTYTANDKDFKTLLQPIINAEVDALFVPNYTQELILIAQQARALGFEGALICGLDACPPFNDKFGEPCDNIFFINNIDGTEQSIVDMVANVKEKTGVEATNKFFLGYDVANILKGIFETVGTDPVAVRDAVEKVADYKGLTGNITIDPATHMPTGLEMVMFTYNDVTPVMLERYAAN